jgi:hypothetical protein
MMQREGIAMLETRDQDDTARELCEFAHDMLTMVTRSGSGARTAVPVQRAQPLPLPVEHPMDATWGHPMDATWEHPMDATWEHPVRPIATEVRPRPTLSDEIIGVFSAFPGLGPVTARKCAMSGISIASFVTFSKKCPSDIVNYAERYAKEHTYVIDVSALEGIWQVSHEIARALIAYGEKCARGSVTQSVDPDTDDADVGDALVADVGGSLVADCVGSLVADCVGSLATVCALSRTQLANFKVHARACQALGSHVYECLHSIIVIK